MTGSQEVRGSIPLRSTIFSAPEGAVFLFQFTLMKHRIAAYRTKNVFRMHVKCIRHGKNSSGTQRWFCLECKSSFTPKIDNSSKQLNMFLKWLFGRSTQGNMPGGSRTFHRNTAKFWNLCRYEHSGAWKALMSRIAEPVMVVSDGGSGFNKALRKTWPHS